jgi:hypothetical protein
MKTIYNCTNYGNDIRLTLKDAKLCSQSGDCGPYIDELLTKPYVKKQVATLNPLQLAKELKDYGAWSSEELKNHEENVRRWLWLSAGNITENIE